LIAVSPHRRIGEWGLRDYGVEQIFGGDKNCDHKWDRKIKKWHSDRGKGPRKEVFDDSFQIKGTRNDTCLKCEAWKGQLGLEPTPEMYIEHMTEIFNEVKRVLKNEGILWLVIGDSYVSKPAGNPGCSGIGKSVSSSHSQRGDTTTAGLPPKCLCMIPERLAWSLIQNGWILRNKIIWNKPNAMPSSVKDRFSNKWEYLFLFVKSDKPVYWTNKKILQLVAKKPLGIKGVEGIDWEWREVQEWKQEEKKGYEMGSVDPHRAAMRGGLLGGGKHKKQKGKLKKVSLWTAHDYYFDLDAVREPHLPQSITRAQGHDYTSGPWAVPGGVNGEHGRIHELGKNPGDVFEVGAETRTLGAIIGSGGAVKVPGGQGWTGHPKGGGAACQKDPRWCPPEGKNPGDFWNIATQPFPEAHFAVFPEKLCEKPIKVGCPEQVCKKCGKARERIIKHRSNYAKREHAHAPRSEPSKVDSTGWNPSNIQQIGWTSCDCNADFEGGIVLDPFCGAGTVLYVAKQLRRRYIGVDIKQEYCDMSEKRLAQGVL